VVRAGIPIDTAAQAFGLNVATLRTYYLAKDRQEVADKVVAQIADRVRVKK
jgi:hypothetical protein